RTPPVARPLPGNSAKSDTFARPGSVPGSVPVGVEIVTTTASAGSTAPKKSTSAFGASLMPAMPPAAAPWGRTAEAAKCSSCASEVTKTSSSSSRLWAAPTSSSPGLSAITSKSGRFGKPPGATRLTTPWRVPSVIGCPEAGDARASPRSLGSGGGGEARRRARRELHRVRGDGGQIHGREADEATAGGDGSELPAGRAVHGREDRVVLGAPRRRGGRLGAVGQVDAHGTARRGEHHEGGDIRD